MPRDGHWVLRAIFKSAASYCFLHSDSMGIDIDSKPQKDRFESFQGSMMFSPSFPAFQGFSGIFLGRPGVASRLLLCSALRRRFVILIPGHLGRDLEDSERFHSFI